MSSEAFLYLWYDAPNKKYYLGKHKGSPDDSYTHSSTVWESFTKSTIPDGVRRRILAYGTDGDMTKLEYDLLLNRQQKCWDRYYNVSAGWPIRVDNSGTNNPMYGRNHSEEAKKKMSEASKRINLSDETRKKMSEASKRINLSEETRKKMSEASKRINLSEETRKRMSESTKGKNNSMYGRKFSEEHRKKISEANKGRKLSEESRKKIGKASSVRLKAYWQAQTEEHKKKRGQMLNAAGRKKHREMKEQANV